MRGDNLGIKRPPLQTKEPAWLGIDSRNGRFLFGAGGEPIDGVIPPGQSAIVTASPQVLFRAERLFVSRACASDFVIRYVLVGQRFGAILPGVPIIAEPFAVDFDDLPRLAAEFSDGKRPVRINIDRKAIDAVGGAFPLPTVQPGLDISFNVEHIGSEPRRFMAALFGAVAW